MFLESYCHVVNETKRIFQVGTQQRSEFDLLFLEAVAIVHAGVVSGSHEVEQSIVKMP